MAPFQAFLVGLGVSHPAIDGFVHLAQEHGIPAKITGAGGGGYMLAMFPKGPMYYLKMLQIRRALKSDPRTRDYHYTLSDLKTTDKGVSVSLQYSK
jgi:mevalonate kinase